MTEQTESLIANFISSFKALSKKKKEKNVFREARLLDIRYRLTLDLRISIESKYSHTKTKSVRDCYERLFRFLDLWNVYELCRSYGERLRVCGKNKTSDWNENFLLKTRILDFLQEQAERFKKQFVSSENKAKKFRQYIKHFSELGAINGNKKKLYDECLSALEGDFDYKQLLFIQYMERNAYYHGGEAARGGIDYGYRKKQFDFYIAFLTEFVARMGAELFNKELTMEEN